MSRYDSAVPPEFESSTLLFFLRTSSPPELDEPTRERIQQAHLDSLTALTEQGIVVTAGPFDEQTDANFRGLCAMTVPPAKAVAIMASDPAVKAGLLRCEAVTWYRFKGFAAFGEGATVPER